MNGENIRKRLVSVKHGTKRVASLPTEDSPPSAAITIRHVQVTITESHTGLEFSVPVLVHGTFEDVLKECAAFRRYRDLMGEVPGDQDSYRGVNMKVENLPPVSAEVEERLRLERRPVTLTHEEAKWALSAFEQARVRQGRAVEKTTTSWGIMLLEERLRASLPTTSPYRTTPYPGPGEASESAS